MYGLLPFGGYRKSSKVQTFTSTSTATTTTIPSSQLQITVTYFLLCVITTITVIHLITPHSCWSQLFARTNHHIKLFSPLTFHSCRHQNNHIFSQQLLSAY
ncbi:hypothetical protein E2C01_067154 [Portunus trituberculatus]|uniref:Uncharacterized protein n=1 Tax=Portunus trituberculatus TaxID=210409 RepID=A0A5B7HK82_PORTR|nr:hypothetical protein [Portunus trituberculatus]